MTLPIISFLQHFETGHLTQYLGALVYGRFPACFLYDLKQSHSLRLSEAAVYFPSS